MIVLYARDRDRPLEALDDDLLDKHGCAPLSREEIVNAMDDLVDQIPRQREMYPDFAQHGEGVDVPAFIIP